MTLGWSQDARARAELAEIGRRVLTTAGVPTGRTTPSFVEYLARNADFNVADYGAVGDGTTDDTEAVTDCLTAAALANGRVVGEPGKVYRITSPVVATVLDALAVDLRGSVLVADLTDDGTSDAALDFGGDADSVLHLAQFTLRHTYASGSTLLGLRTTAEFRAVLSEQVIVTGFPHYGVDVQAAQQTWVNCRAAENRQAGLSAAGSGTIALVNCDCSDNGPGANTGGYGALLSGGNAVVLGGRFRSNDRYGIDLRRADNAVVDGAYVYDSGYVGIYGVNEDSEKDARNIRVVNCTVDMNDRVDSSHAIWLGSFGASSTVAFREAIVSQNTIRNVLGQGVLIGTGSGTENPDKVVVHANLLEAVDGAAIAVGGTASITAAVVSDNILRDTGNITITNVETVRAAGNLRTQASGNASNFIAITGDSVTEITGNLSPMTYTADPFTWEAPRAVVRDNLAAYGSQVRELTASLAAIPDNTATDVLTITVPNVEIGGTVLVDYVLNDADKGDCYYTGQLRVQVARFPGVAAQASVGYAIAEQSLSTASGFARTITATFAVAVAGAVTDPNTVTLRVTADTSDNLTSHLKYTARCLMGGKTGGATDLTLTPA